MADLSDFYRYENTTKNGAHTGPASVDLRNSVVDYKVLAEFLAQAQMDENTHKICYKFESIYTLSLHLIKLHRN